MNIKDKKILIITSISSAVVASLITYFATKTNYQEQYYAQLLEEKAKQASSQEKLGEYKKLNYGNEKTYLR